MQWQVGNGSASRSCWRNLTGSEWHLVDIVWLKCIMSSCSWRPLNRGKMQLLRLSSAMFRALDSGFDWSLESLVTLDLDFKNQKRKHNGGHYGCKGWWSLQHQRFYWLPGFGFKSLCWLIDSSNPLGVLDAVQLPALIVSQEGLKLVMSFGLGYAGVWQLFWVHCQLLLRWSRVTL